jgi:hypothetical protein
MSRDRVETLAQILYEDACNENMWPVDLDPWLSLDTPKRVVYMQRATRILRTVDNLETLRFLS